MAIVKSDYEKVDTGLFIHKIKPNVFLLRKVIGSKYFTKVLTLEIRSGWSKREYKNEAKKELVKWLDSVTKQVKGLNLKIPLRLMICLSCGKAKKISTKSPSLATSLFMRHTCKTVSAKRS